MVKPLTDVELARFDAALMKHLSSELTIDGEFTAALRERLRLAEKSAVDWQNNCEGLTERLSEVEMYAGSDREERQFWESRYVEVRDQLRLADAVADLATSITPDSGLDRWDQLYEAIGAYNYARDPT